MFIIEISYNFLYVWNCMELYDKKFLIYGNCMIRSFGQPGDVFWRESADALLSRITSLANQRIPFGTLLRYQFRPTDPEIFLKALD